MTSYHFVKYKVDVFTQANIVQLAQSVPTLSTLVTAVIAANLTNALSASSGSKGALTVLAPNNAAFAKLPPATLEKLLLPENIRDLANVLELHVFYNPNFKNKNQYTPAVYLKDFKDNQTITTINGLKLTVSVKGDDVFIRSGNPFAEASKIIAGDNPAVNGAVHIIDTVLIPSKGPDPLPTPTPTPKQCNPDKGTCNVCKACCKAYIESQANCDSCISQEC
jgi:uncharacterized surface protein with fasciclin (FAS1) repeats